MRRSYNRIPMFFLLVFSLLTFLIGSVTEARHFFMAGFVGVWIASFYFVCRKSYFGACFLISFFTFLCGRLIFNWFNGSASLLAGAYITNTPRDGDVLPILWMMLISLLSFTFVMQVQGRARLKSNLPELKKTAFAPPETLALACALLFYFSIIMKLLVSGERMIFVLTTGYTDYYLSFSTKLPYLVGKIAALASPAFFAFLATNPKKNVLTPIMLLYLMDALVLMLAGQRNHIVRAIIICVAYLLLRNKREPEAKWLRRRHMVAFVALVPIGIVGLQAWGTLRNGEAFQISGIWDTISDFFSDQGSTSAVLYHGAAMQEQFPADTNYTFAAIVNFFRNNVITQFLFDFEIYASQTVELALYGNNYGATLAYLAIPNHYLAGITMGTSYIAEVFHDFGWVGLILINFLYAYLLKLLEQKLSARVSGGVWGKMLLLIFVNGIIYAPRNSVFTFLAEGINLTVLLFVILAILLSIVLAAGLKRIKRTKEDAT